jgi:hypothetical protein
MGLDMYLRASKYVSGFAFAPDEEQKMYDELIGMLGLDRTDTTEDSPGLSVMVTVAYWRKVNAVHAWFVREVQGGRDECQEAYVPREKLVQLAATCEQAIVDQNSELLPPQAGFFFGDTAVDDYYWQDLAFTRDQVRAILNNPKLADFEFYYQSSW